MNINSDSTQDSRTCLHRRSLLRRSAAISAAFALAGLPAPRASAQSASASPASATPAAPPPRTESGYVPVNGLEMYYEVYGSGSPLLMLHGGLGTIQFPGGALMSALAETRQVIAVEQQAHGHTADIDRPLSYEQMVEDTATFIQQMGLEGADVFGFSMGGTTALGIGIKYPELVRKLVIASAPFNNDGMKPENIEGTQNMTPEALTGTPMEQLYLDVAPNPEDWPILLTKTGELSENFAGWLPADIQTIAAPTQVVVGDSDAIPLEHAIELFTLLGGGVNGDFVGLPASQLAITPGASHFSALANTALLMEIIAPFLDAQMPEGA